MRLVTYRSPTGPRIAGVRERAYVDLNQTDPEIPAGMRDFLAGGAGSLERAKRALALGRAFPADSVELLAPVPDPEKVICIGLNYADHAAETGRPPPAEPVVFSKFPTAVTAHESTIVLPTVSQKVDFEAELIVVLGRGGKNIPRHHAWTHVAGYACGHDVSARDWQQEKPGGQWLLGKSFDGFAPFGPELVTADEIADVGSLDICLRLNGQTMQRSNTRQLIFPIDQLIAYISQVCTLRTGDVLFTGTPPGVGMARKPPVYLQAGDVVEVEIESIGLLRNRFAAEG